MKAIKHYKGYVIVPFDEYAQNEGCLKYSLYATYGIHAEVEILEEDIVPREEWLADEMYEKNREKDL